MLTAMIAVENGAQADEAVYRLLMAEQIKSNQAVVQVEETASMSDMK